MSVVNSGTIKVKISSPVIETQITPQKITGTTTVPARVQGLQGIPGKSGVYVGSTEPGEDVTVWVDPNGSTTEFVRSVNGKTGVVQLAAVDVGALPDDVQIPDEVELLTNSDILAIWNSF